MQFTSTVNELQYQDGEDQHVTTEIDHVLVDVPVVAELMCLKISETVVRETFSSQVCQPSIALDRARRVGV